MTSPASSILLSGIGKSFKGVRALGDVSVEVRVGTVHALVGENGAGKSTLGKIIAGVLEPDSGSIEFDQVPVSFSSPRDAIARGVTMVAQELALVPTRSVLENVYLGAEITSGPFIRTRKLREEFRALSKRTGVHVDPSLLVGDLSIAEQQKVEILRALARNSSVIIMDEPTARLATDEARNLRTIIKHLRDSGTTIVYVSHFLEEVLDLADDITVLRDGSVISSGTANGETVGTLIERMIGRGLDSVFPPKQFPVGSSEPRLRISGLGGNGFSDISFEIQPGEIVALAGLVGAGRTEVVRAIYGADPASSGIVEIDAFDFRRRQPIRSIKHGIVMLPESRKEQGLFIDFSIAENVSISALDKFSSLGFIRKSLVGDVVTRLLDEVNIKMRSSSQTVGRLSGGNQQKTLFAKALITKPRLLIVDEPTRGVDVGAKRQIYDLLTRLAQSGLSILMVSSEMEEVVGMAHQVVVMRQGRMSGVLKKDEITEQRIAALAFGGTASGSII